MFRWPSTLDASPIVSTNKLPSTSHTRHTFAIQLISHLRRYGFARLSNHSVAPSTIKGLFKCHRNFFNLSLSEKLAVRHPGGESPARGYSPWAFEKTAVLRPDLHSTPNLDLTENTSPDQALSLNSSPSHQPNAHVEFPKSHSKALLDAREQFAIGPPNDIEFPTPQLPEESLPGSNAVMNNAYQEIANACRTLVDTIEEGLGAPANSMSLTAGGARAELNLNFYPETERNVLEDSADARRSDGKHTEDNGDVTLRRIWPHTDLGVISALFPDGLGETGLELQVRESPGGKFAPLSIEEEGDMVLLVADTLERWTNGDLRAAVHRVGSPSLTSLTDAAFNPGTTRVPERRSAVMFYRAAPTTDVGPLPYCVSAHNPPKYKSMTAGEYLKNYNKKLY
ncbi:Clavaminate synthase-like protein [Whalleya microplaca]|nr:Clavaminate synthase-like protein [Whalleya microplaca]